ncbi:HK97 gp10 family phage protein [Humitalea sp. 24SJ18S-53]|uniref:HK97 gp10 family phage protein n=1 Tax=Humitalea sp. 24SJ18S-53 TaxID=3422307 RepID=UPI003D67B000
MASPVSLRLDDAALRGLMASIPVVMTEELSAGLAEISLFAEREIKERTPTSGAGTLRDSIGALPVTLGGGRITAGVGTALAYAAPLELGSKPHWAPIAPLLDWVQRKLGKSGEEAEGMASAIRFKIARHGSKGHFFFRDGMAFVEAPARGILAAAVARAAARAGA